MGLTDEDRIILWVAVVGYALCLAVLIGTFAAMLLPLLSRCGSLA